MTLLENMAMADNKNRPYNITPGVNRRRVSYYKELLSSLGLGLEDKLNIPVGSLSGGQRQALALLMSTLTPIEFLILDEHTRGAGPQDRGGHHAADRPAGAGEGIDHADGDP